MRFYLIVIFIAGILGMSTASACVQIEGKLFQSVELFGMGQGRDGVSMGHRTIEFKDGKFDWLFADYSHNGTYTCSGNKITGAGYGGAYAGEYLPEQGILIWQGDKYRLP
jgi:hypothetical protein